MLLQVSDFCHQVRNRPQQLAARLRDLTGREGEAETRAWLASLPRVAEALESPALQKLHLNLNRRASIDIEYQLPSAGSWCDAVLLGQGPMGPAALIMELKHWITGDDQPGPSESLVRHAGDLRLHPSDQVRGYTEYCQRFHSGVREHEASVHGCVYFTRSTHYTPYLQPPHDYLAREYPVFGVSPHDLNERLPAYIASLVSEPNERFAADFANGTYEQDRRFVRQVAGVLKESEESPFVLLDEQRRGYELAVQQIEEALAAGHPEQRHVIIIEGPPGSGKSVLAAQLWSRLATHPEIEGNVVFVTTSGCQKAVWKDLFTTVSGKKAAAGLVVPANAFNPGLRATMAKEMREQGHAWTVDTWRENLELFAAARHRSKCPDLQYEVSIVDEAHALMDPTVEAGRGAYPSGWVTHAGPQGWHIVRASRISVFLMDSHQSYRDNETTTPDSIREYARDHGVTDVTRVSLHGAQFRCGGSKAYTDWVDSMLGREGASTTPSLDWRKTSSNLAGTFEFEIVDDLHDLDRALRARSDEGFSVRLAASYARKWRTKGVSDPHGLPPDEMDFNEPSSKSQTGRWARVWNYAPELDYTLFVQGPAGAPIGIDPLCEVGCPYVLRGFDFDYIGLLWLSDLVWRDGEWRSQLEHIHESAWKSTVSRARKEPRVESEQLLAKLKRGYRILLTRAIRGAYLWCEDEETRCRISENLECMAP